jgi:flagellar motor switch protein FliN/FliY
MTFSASPLVPGTGTGAAGGTGWQATAAAALSAVAEALGQIPSAAPLTARPPVAEPALAHLPVSGGAAVTAYIGGTLDGKLLLVVGRELVEALQGTPFGALEPAQALKPALETIADRIGGRLDGAPTAIALDDCLEVLSGGVVVGVPLESGGQVTCFVGISLSAPLGSAPAPAGVRGGSWGIDMLRDVEMEVTCELGRTRMTVRQLLALAPGDVVELDRLAGAPADLLVNGTLLARGEVVVVDESFGLRITEIVTRDAT